MDGFGIKDALDILIVAFLLFYLYRIMRESGTINIFVGVLAFIVVWVVASEILEMRLIGTIMDKFMSIGLLVLVILFQDQIKRFLVELGSHQRWNFLKHLFRHHGKDSASDNRRWVMPIESYEKSGDMIDAAINARLIENIFFKNSPLHDGALIIAHDRLKAAGCILPVSHDTNVPRSFGLRHRSALGISQATDAFAIVVSEETGNISVAHRGVISTRLSSTDLEHRLSHLNLSE